MSKSIAILGKAGVGKTFLAAQLAMAFGYLGEKTLLVGCDQKRDTTRAVSAQRRPSLVEALEANGFSYENTGLADITIQVNEYVDVMELGPSQLLVGDYGKVFDEAFRLFDLHDGEAGYARIVYDVNDERYDASHAPLFRRVEGAVAVTDESSESLFVLNRLLRAALIGGFEFGFPLRVAGVVNNRSLDPQPFEAYVERSKCFPLLSIPERPELARLRELHRTVFHAENPGGEMEELQGSLVKLAELLRGGVFNLYPVSPLEDEEIWRLAPPARPLN